MARTEGQSQTQRERRATAEAALLDAAAHLVADRGIDNTSLAEIGEAAGYSRGLVNHHFGTKAALVARLAERTQTEVAALLPDPSTTTLRELVDGYLELASKDEWWARAYFALCGAAVPKSAALRDIMAERDERLRAHTAEIVASDQQRGLIRSDIDPGSLALTIVGMIRGISTQLFVDGDVDIDGARSVSDALLQSLGPHGSPGAALNDTRDDS